MGQIPIKGQKGQFRWQSTHGQRFTSPNALIGQYPRRNATLDDEKSQERWDFTLLTLTKKARAVSITDCQAGNP
ncbi:hypothetical protein Tco_0967604, partial [Tanacetum coccineum]